MTTAWPQGSPHQRRSDALLGCQWDDATSNDENVVVAVEFECETRLSLTPAEAFDLSLRVDVHTASLAHSCERASANAGSMLGLGDEVTWRARHFGLPWTMTSKIVKWDRPSRFVDEQESGPFATFRHEHVFEPHGGGTRMTDRVAFRAPLGPIGRLFEKAVLGRYMRRLIQTRNGFLASQSADGTLH
jgi:ligand-binding SRPBCC domain-containing protein